MRQFAAREFSESLCRSLRHPLVVAFDRTSDLLVRGVSRHLSPLSFLDGSEVRNRPASTMKTWVPPATHAFLCPNHLIAPRRSCPGGLPTAPRETDVSPKELMT